jgi:hypothetical protein
MEAQEMMLSFGDCGNASAERALLGALQSCRDELKMRLEESSTEWGFDDPIYRFYHQSFKVYSLQSQTQAIVRLLASLVPDRTLNPWFLQIVEEGTGRQFTPADNADWPLVTRPIVEAFFHARLFLQMAVRYAYVAEHPRVLPGGHPALVYLCGLR